jgi:hypothetical protein
MMAVGPGADLTPPPPQDRMATIALSIHNQAKKAVPRLKEKARGTLGWQ